MHLLGLQMPLWTQTPEAWSGRGAPWGARQGGVSCECAQDLYL